MLCWSQRKILDFLEKFSSILLLFCPQAVAFLSSYAYQSSLSQSTDKIELCKTRLATSGYRAWFLIRYWQVSLTLSSWASTDFLFELRIAKKVLAAVSKFGNPSEEQKSDIMSRWLSNSTHEGCQIHLDQKPCSNFLVKHCRQWCQIFSLSHTQHLQDLQADLASVTCLLKHLSVCPLNSKSFSTSSRISFKKEEMFSPLVVSFRATICLMVCYSKELTEVTKQKSNPSLTLYLT